MSLRLRLLAAFAYVVVLVLVALELPLALTVSDRADAELEAQAAAQAHLIAASASGRLGDSAALDRVVERGARDLSGRVVVVGPGGRLLADSAGDRPGTSYAGRPEIAAVLARGRTEQGRRYSATLDQNLLYTAVPVVSRGQRVGAVRVTQSVEALEQRVRRDVLVLLGLGGVALVLGLVLAWLLAGSLARPLHALAHAARRVGRGELEVRAAVKGSTEQQEVARAFNEMAERLGQVLVAHTSSSPTPPTNSERRSPDCGCGSSRRPCARTTRSSDATSRLRSTRPSGSRSSSAICSRSHAKVSARAAGRFRCGRCLSARSSVGLRRPNWRESSSS